MGKMKKRVPLEEMAEHGSMRAVLTAIADLESRLSPRSRRRRGAPGCFWASQIVFSALETVFRAV